MLQTSQCLKILKNVSFNIASEASYVYILSGKKFIKNAQNGEVLKSKAWYQKVLPDRSFLVVQKLLENAKKLTIFWHF